MQLEEELAELQTRIQGLPEQDRKPKTAFDLLGATEEASWQAYLSYFLDPSAPHGLDERFLRETLTHLTDIGAISFSPSQTALRRSKEIQVIDERQSENDNRPDIVVAQEEEWFLCIELKIGAPEDTSGTPQTVRYANDRHIVPGTTDEYDNSGYVYIKPASESESQSSEFADVDWQQLRPVLGETIAVATGDAPARTLTQLSDLDTAIQNQLTMTELDEVMKEKKNLYFEYRDTIEEAQEAIDPFVQQVLQKEWAEMLANGFCPDNYEEFQWRLSKTGTSYGQVRTPRWQEAKTDPEELDIHWEHKPTEKAFKGGWLRFLLELEEPDRSTISESSGERYHQFRDDILGDLDTALEQIENPRWNESEHNPGGSDKKLFKAEYTYSPGDETGYYQQLQYALEDTEPITQLVTNLLETKTYAEYSV